MRLWRERVRSSIAGLSGSSLSMQDGNSWTKCLPLPSEPTSLLSPASPDEATAHRRPASRRPRILHMDVEQPPLLHSKRFDILKACCRSSFIVLAAILIGIFISLVSFKLTGWSPGRERNDRRIEYHRFFAKKGSRSTVALHLKELTRLPHVAGSAQDMVTADYVLSAFEKYGLSARYKDYDVLLSFPVKRSLSLQLQNGSEVRLSLTEDLAGSNFNSSIAQVIPPFHAYAPSGNVVAHVVYVNYGRKEDYKKLDELGVNVSGAIVIARNGDVYRGDIVSTAANAGASAVILYSDPKDYANGGKSGFYPDFEWLPPSGVQRGTVFQGIGDPLTPGWPSSLHSERLAGVDLASRLPQIPSLPISADDALRILSALDGPVAPLEWHGSLELTQYRVGGGPAKLNFEYEAVHKIVTVRNVFAVVEGSKEPDRFILLGNHRDAWTFGAVDPNSGTAALLEIARRFGKLRRRGWKPRRSIMLCSWDAEEYGLIGSTEWVEENSDLLAVRAVAYLNVDCAVAGSGFHASATPQLDLLLKEVTKEVHNPDLPHGTVYDSWVAAIKDQKMVARLGGGGSDFAAFLQHIGVPSMDIRFGEDYPVYHSLYDNFDWMEKFGDPSFQRHVAASTIWGLAALRLADDAILPFDYTTYVDELEVYTRAVEQRLAGLGSSVNVTMEPIWAAIKSFSNAVTVLAQEAEILSSLNMDVENSVYLVARFRILNDRLLQSERAFLDSDGLKGRTWYKHLVYSPSKNNKYDATSFPGINDAISIAISSSTLEEWSAVQHEIWRVSRAIDRAALVIGGQFT